ncbi:MAG: DNA gyrase modulator, partial [Bacillota bacterium]|nr:DNA gyrase modulator [Bacillota bacterium]
MNRLIDTLFEMGKAKGFEAQEVYYSSSESMTVSAYQGEIEKFGISKDGGLSYRGIIDGKLGYSYTERVDESSLEMLIEEAYANGKAIESQDRVFIFGEKRDYVEVNSFDPGLEQVPVEDKIRMPLLLEKRVKEIAPELSDVSSCTYIESVSEMRMRNTLGLDLSDRSNYCLLYGVAMLKDGGETYTAYDGVIGNRYGDLNVETIAQNMVREVRSKVGATPIPS